jgi:hypothetical protein
MDFAPRASQAFKADGSRRELDDFPDKLVADAAKASRQLRGQLAGAVVDVHPGSKLARGLYALVLCGSIDLAAIPLPGGKIRCSISRGACQ